jgi:hypothetical protein
MQRNVCGTSHKQNKMTTNVLDCVNGVLSTDSRWSSDNGDWLAYVDDTQYDKIAFTGRAGFLFAGDMPPIDEWKQYVAGGMKKNARPVRRAWVPGSRISIIQVELATGRIVFKSHNFPTTSFGASVRALFAGTGALHAKTCWDEKKCAKTAIKSAAEEDMRSGGSVIYLDRKTRENNAANTATAESVREQLKDRGFIMNVADKNTKVSLKDAANDVSNPAAQAFAKAVMSGAAPLNAPFPGMDEPWAEEKYAELDVALSEFEED